ncbi:dethiobiotin synthase [Sporosarcina limicola]|uniref:ATP-dependent dethiobiotin synthetase BioD n=1 Tax=Sporosarcina limicola TaxID=34101 RepID=A0A927MIJ5_9BACL|nr:dethiobiotin synthase [Sporosarcina limicola]MBE1555349.1 dethiobiotin synthetase [Sporosarcina limicola]
MTVFFITGTDTDVGKTVVTSLFVSFMKSYGYHCAPFKPIQSGAVQRDGEWIAPDPEIYQLVTEHQEMKDLYAYLLEKPCSPHLAAAHEQVQFDFSFINNKVNKLEKAYDGVILEGAGGLYVPLIEDGYCMIDWMEELHVPTILVARAGVGTINHTVLSVEALVRRKIPIAGIIFNHLHEEEEGIVKDNIHMVEKLTKVPIIGTVPYRENILDVLADQDERQKCYADWEINVFREAFADESATIA